MKKVRSNFYRFLLQVIVLLLAGSGAFAQTTVSGKITDSKDGAAVAGVTITAKGTRVSTQSGADGSYTLNVPAGATTLIFTFTGFNLQEVPISGRSNVSVSMVQGNLQLNEVVVVAYGTRKRGDLTGAVTSVSAKDFQKGNINSSEQLLQGKVAGLQITTGGGSAGGGSTIRIRGGASLSASNDPLIVIDGVPVESNGIAGSANFLNTINPNDIESMTVLKDASATALYGSRASNGVIIITTKKGAKGKVRYNFNTMFTLSKVTKTIDVLSADELRSVINADALATGSNNYKNLLGTANTDWQNEIYRTAFGNDKNLSASGSIGSVPFRASVGYLNQAGILKTNQFDRFTGALNLSPKLFTDHLALNINLKGSGTRNRFADEGAIGSAAAFDPTKPVMSATNKYGGYYEWIQPGGTLPITLATRNPVALLDLRHNTSKVGRFVGNVQADYKVHGIPDLHVLANIGMDYAGGSGNDNTDSIAAASYNTGGRHSYCKQQKMNWLGEVQVAYSKELKSIKSKFDALLGHTYQDFYTNVFNYSAFSYRPIADPSQPQLKDTIGASPTNLTDKPQNRLESYLARVNYTYNNKYLLTASLRRDASSKFAKANRVSYFPAVALAWKLKEDFFKNTHAISDLKLRFGLGTTGNQDGIDNYTYLPYYSPSNANAQYQFGNAYYSFLRPRAYDPERKWESTTTTNIGLDFGFLNGRISGSVDVYKKKTKDLLSEVPVAAGGNFNIVLVTNVGNVENKGIEFVLNTVPVKTKNLTWEFGFNMAYNQTKITNLLKQQDPNFKGLDVSPISGGTGNKIGKFTVGYAPYSFYVYKQIYDASGNPIEGLYEDINRDGVVDDNDRYMYKKPAADVLLGLSTQLTYKQFSLGITGHGSFGNYLYNNYNSGAGVLNSVKNPINFIGNASVNYLETRFTNNRYFSDYYIENASFFRIDNINLGYNAGKVFHDKASLRVSASIQNVALITKYKGLDPENSGATGVDNNIYPRPRIYSLGVNLDF